ncbi:MAG: hypothetical protein J6N47_02295 [Lachnospiraceae bacterium]|nr:hypothetical protein [Lachnospiraceae bacterium]
MAKKIIGIIIAVLFPLLFFLFYIQLYSDKSEFNETTKYVEQNGIYYYSSDCGNSVRIYGIKPNKRIKYGTRYDVKKNENASIEGMAADDENIYVLYAKTTQDRKAYFQILKYDLGLKPIESSALFEIDRDVWACGIDIQDGELYVTVMDEERTQANVYLLGKDIFEDQEENESSSSLSMIYSKESEGARLFTEACYQDGQLFTRMDSDAPAGIFAVPDEIKKIYNSRNSNIGIEVKTGGVRTAGIFAFTCLVIFSGLMVQLVVKKKSRVLGLILSGTVWVIFIAVNVSFLLNAVMEKITQDSAKVLAVDETLYSIDDIGVLESYGVGDTDFYESNGYYSLYSAISDELGEYATVDCKRFLVVNAQNGNVVLDTELMNRQNIGEILGDYYRRMVETCSITKESNVEVASIQGVSYYVVCAPMMSAGKGSYCLIGLYTSPDTDIDVRVGTLLINNCVALMAIIFLIVYFTVDVRVYRDIALIKRALMAAVEDGKEPEVSKEISEDQKLIYTAIRELVRRINRINYAKYQMYSAYYRFSPKNIEQLMHKDSITEVHEGDTAVAKGSMVVFSTSSTPENREVLDNMKFLMDYMETADMEGTVVSNDSMLSKVEMFFDKSNKRMLELGVGYFTNSVRKEMNSSMGLVVYYSEFTVGIAGNSTQAMTFISSPKVRIYERFGEWFSNMGINMVITRKIMERDAGQAEVRYIGYIILPDGSREDMYEVLDACDARERQLKMEYRKKFEDSIDLFYKSDFYLARNRFSDLLKNCPADRLAKWYLFKCEKCLSGGYMGEEGMVLDYNDDI